MVGVLNVSIHGPEDTKARPIIKHLMCEKSDKNLDLLATDTPTGSEPHARLTQGMNLSPLRTHNVSLAVELTS